MTRSNISVASLKRKLEEEEEKIEETYPGTMETTKQKNKNEEMPSNAKSNLNYTQTRARDFQNSQIYIKTQVKNSLSYTFHVAAVFLPLYIYIYIYT